MRAGRAAEADDRLTEASLRAAERWNLVLVVFMRGLALAWIAKGLASWAVILGLAGGAMPFEGATVGYQAIVAYFAVIDLIAGVGLWLTSSWGGVLWLLAVMSHLILAAFFSRFVSNGALVIALFIFAIALYLTFSWLAAAEE